MSDLDATTPSIFLVRHGETEWTKNGRYTAITDIPLTAEGERQVESTTKQLVGPGRLIDPGRVAHVRVSPRRRAQQTFRLLFGDDSAEVADEKVALTEDFAEWGYGDYEGLVAEDIVRRRKPKAWTKPASIVSEGTGVKAAR
ncbi:hypothetical protein AYL99_07182 [Fonsecaea erecta]|uniref:Phosphoglycerate mutase n=1 Tax=Fonsecaea erecta TaxID=1367422 RepID=A0A178ZEM6_9EURO|nr:hypothetical protein AYL99_07182 [Fonsecaea erecta]OAP58092.1 hypothetical protein AYL99_07182 [Fonsecaea erecta]